MKYVFVLFASISQVRTPFWCQNTIIISELNCHLPEYMFVFSLFSVQFYFYKANSQQKLSQDILQSDAAGKSSFLMHKKRKSLTWKSNSAIWWQQTSSQAQDLSCDETTRCLS